MLQYSLEVGICWAILYLIYIAFLRRETFFSINRWYLLSSLGLGLLIPVLRTIPVGFQEEAVVVHEALYFISAGPELIAANIAPQETAGLLTLNNLLLLVYSLGVLFVGTRLIIGLLKIKNLYTSGQRTNKGSFTLVETEQFHLPFSFLNCVFFSKEMPINDNIEKILKHELTHVQSWHTLDVLFTEVLQVLFWFNPLIVLYKKAIKESHEYVADASVLQDTSQKIYGQILLRQSQSGLQIALANHFFHSHIKKRLTMMKQKKSKWPALMKYLFAMPVILLLMVLFQSQALPEETLSKSKSFDKELTQAFESENSYYTVKDYLEKRKEEYLMKELREDFEALYHNTDHDKNIMLTLSKFGNLLNLYVGKYPSKKDFIKRSFISNGKSMGMKIGFENGSNKFNYLLFVVPDDLHDDYQAGKLPEYDELMVGNKLVENSVFGRRVSDNSFGADTIPNQFRHLLEGEVSQLSGNQFIPDGMENPVWVINGKVFLKDENFYFTNKNLRSIRILKNSEARKKYNTSNHDGAIEVTTENQIHKVDNSNLPSPPPPPPPPPSQEEIWSQIEANAHVFELFIDGEKVTVEEAMSKKGQVHLSSLRMNALDKDKIEQVYFSEREEIYKVVQQMPRFPGCEEMNGTNQEKEECAKQEMLKFIYSNLRYPKAAMKSGIEGTNVVQFVVRADGSIDDIKMLRDIGGGTAEATLQMMDKLSATNLKWNPGYQSGKAVAVQYTLPVRFKLADDCEGCESQEFSKNSNAQDDKPLIVLDGVKQSRLLFDLDKHIKAEQIESINVIKGEKAIDKYGEDGKDGVVEIITKQNTKKREYVVVSDHDEELYRVVDEMPRFPGCEDMSLTTYDKEECSKKELLKFIYSNLKYPVIAREEGIEGTTVVQFVIDKNGEIRNEKVVRDIKGAFEEAVYTVIDEMRLQGKIWTPGKQKGKNVNLLFTLPIKFKLEGDSVGKVDSEESDELYNTKTADHDLNSSSTLTQEQAYANELFQNEPNPFGAFTYLPYSLEKAAKVTLIVNDITGKVIFNTSFDSPKGKHRYKLTNQEIGNTKGVLYYSIESENFKKTRKMMVFE